jgi:hypothetical protein
MRKITFYNYTNLFLKNNFFKVLLNEFQEADSFLGFTQDSTSLVYCGARLLYCKCKVKLSLYVAMKAQRGSKGIAILIL